MPEGTVCFPHEPLLRVRGPLLECQLLETPLLTLVNFQTLIATKAARICQAARGEPVLEFGLRRAQGVDGGITASRAAYIGGCAATSNVLAGRLFDIPVRGTHAHSWVMSFDDELSAFRAYAEAMPNNCVFLVDTYDTLEGVRRAVEVGRWLREQGHEMLGIRLDSGDLAYLSIEARKILDDGWFSASRHRRLQRPGRARDLQPQGARGHDRRLGRRHAAGHQLRSAGARGRLQALARSSPPAAAGSTRSNSPSRRSRSRRRASCRCGASATRTGSSPIASGTSCPTSPGGSVRKRS